MQCAALYYSNKLLRGYINSTTIYNMSAHKAFAIINDFNIDLERTVVIAESNPPPPAFPSREGGNREDQLFSNQPGVMTDLMTHK